MRDYRFDDIRAQWTYAHRSESKDLAMAKFWLAPNKKARQDGEDHSPATAMIQLIRGNPGLSQSALQELADQHGVRYTKKGPGSDTAFRKFLDTLKSRGKIRYEDGPRNTTLVYPLPVEIDGEEGPEDCPENYPF